MGFWKSLRGFFTTGGIRRYLLRRFLPEPYELITTLPAQSASQQRAKELTLQGKICVTGI